MRIMQIFIALILLFVGCAKNHTNNEEENPDCIWYDCFGICNGNAEEDNCGICAGNNDCECPNGEIMDCTGECSGSAVLDDCGVCNGDNSTCQDAFGLDNTLDILTWNIQNFPKSNNTTITTVAGIINQLDVDIIALQEIESSGYFTNLKNELDGWDGFKANSASHGIDLAFLYKTELSIENIYEISSLNSDYLPRTPLLMELIWNDEHIYIINNHYKCCGDGNINYSDSWDEEYRRLQGSILIESYIENNLSDKNVIVLGDLNDSLTDSNSSNVFLSFINESQKYLFVDESIATGNSSYWSWPGWYSSYSASHFDHILITNELFDEFDRPLSLCQTVLAEDYLQGGWQEYDSVVSDHRPVGIRLQFE